jgi:acyl-CoA reductase-like NAD-dependent aldehyde dehydrogenase
MTAAATNIRHTGLFMDNAWTEASDTFTDLNPATEQPLTEIAAGTAHDIDVAVQSARRALEGAWGATPGPARALVLNRIADLIERDAEILARLEALDIGKPVGQPSMLDVPNAVATFRHFAGWADKVTGTVIPTAGYFGRPTHSYTVREPVGVIGAIVPWNTPLMIAAWKLGPALAAGNTVVVKPAPQDPLAIVELVRILNDAGFPPGVVNLVNGNGPAASAALVDADEVDCVSFTGSTQVGVTIAEKAARTMKRTLLELGGKGACVVFDDADVKAAVGCIGSTWSFHSGQICTAPTRAVVHRSLFDQVRDGLVQMAGFLKVGDPTDTATIIGPVISAAQRARIEAHIQTAKEDGGEIVIGGERPADLPVGFYVAPTLITGDNKMRVAREEIFGPVITMIPFEDEEEGIAIANDTEFGLYDYVFSQDGARALRVAKRLQAGHVGINTAQRNHDAPFGGFKMSGVGRDGGDYGLLAYTEPQAIIWSS